MHAPGAAMSKFLAGERVPVEAVHDELAEVLAHDAHQGRMWIALVDLLNAQRGGVPSGLALHFSLGSNLSDEVRGMMLALAEAADPAADPARRATAAGIIALGFVGEPWRYAKLSAAEVYDRLAPGAAFTPPPATEAPMPAPRVGPFARRVALLAAGIAVFTSVITGVSLALIGATGAP